MKNCILLLKSALLLALLPACNSASNDAKKGAETLGQYVDSVNKVTPEYTNAYWASIDSGYQARLTEIKASESELNEADKKKLEESKDQFETMKVAYTAKIKEAKEKKNENDYRLILRNSLFGQGKVGSDMQFKYVTAENILGVYENFVNTVSDKKTSYTREDWDEIKVLYEALDTRKNEVEKDLSSNDNLKIAKLKVRFATIKAFHRGGSKGEENKKAKEN